MTTLVVSALTELLPTASQLLYDPFGSHSLRVLLLLLSGTPPTAEGRAGAERSKKSREFRKGQGKMRSFLGPSGDDEPSDVKGKGKKLRTPDEFAEALRALLAALDTVDEGGPAGEGVRRAAMDDVAGPAVRILLELESAQEGGWKAGSWADRVLCGLVEEVEDPASATAQRTDLREEYLAGLLRHPASGPTFETLLLRSNKKVFDAIWSAFFDKKLHRLAGNAVANFVVAVGISRLDEQQFVSTVEELRAIATERRAEWIDNTRTGVLRSLLERAAELQVGEEQVSEVS